MQFIGPIKQTWLTKIRKAGADLVQPYAGFSYIARLDTKQLATIAKLPFVRWIGHLPYTARLAEDAITGARRKPNEPDPAVPRTRFRSGVYTVLFFRREQAAKAVKEVRELGFEIWRKTKNSDFLIVQTTARRPPA